MDALRFAGGVRGSILSAVLSVAPPVSVGDRAIDTVAEVAVWRANVAHT